MTVKQLTAADTPLAASIAALERECFAEPWSEAAVLESLKNPLYTFLAALSGESIHGYVGAFTVAGEMQITNVAVTATARRQGVGNALIHALITEAKRLSSESITLEVRA
ncbi:MAG: GNAT family N-acetyltransferase [Clostridia bacterium]|nr:GNAT family N-acetyltransferase [Clostridia bacterium]